VALGVDIATQPSVSQCVYDKSPVRMHLYPPAYQRIRCLPWSCCSLHHHTIPTCNHWIP
jgi:hypothetical protein